VRTGVLLILLALSIDAIRSMTSADGSTDPDYADVVSHLQALPGASCSPTPSGVSTESCIWGRWTLALSPETGTAPEFCHGKNEQHVWFGFGNWHLTLVPLVVARELPDLTNDEYAALQHAFDFGSGGAFQAC
jgi:hypothetical protein